MATLRIKYVSSPVGINIPNAPKRLNVETGFGTDATIHTNRRFWRRNLVGEPTSRPVAFQLAPLATGNNRNLPIVVKGSYDGFTLPGSLWGPVGAGQRRLRLTASLSAGVNIVSGYTHWNANGTFIVNNFRFTNATVVDHAFRVVHDWTWTMEAEILHVGVQPAIQVVAPETTPIEMFVLVGDIDPLFQTSVKAELLRWAIPRHADFAALTAGETLAQVQHRYIRWLARSLFFDMPTNTRLQYDAWMGSSSLATVIPFTGTRQLELSTWLNAARRRRDNTWRRVNCSDHAILVQTCCRAYGKENTNTNMFIDVEVQSVKVWGYVPDGMLSGWPNHPRLNNPLFKSNNSTPHVNQNDPNRTAFSAHFWAEFTDAAAAAPTVVDVCHALLGADLVAQNLVNGNMGRLAFFATCIDPIGPQQLAAPGANTPVYTMAPPVAAV